ETLKCTGGSPSQFIKAQEGPQGSEGLRRRRGKKSKLLATWWCHCCRRRISRRESRSSRGPKVIVIAVEPKWCRLKGIDS
ncbi:hypothetical protein Ancab_034159, partial [Ancistrocladus abbreviatus]